MVEELPVQVKRAVRACKNAVATVNAAFAKINYFRFG
jgi:hypothetical protein